MGRRKFTSEFKTKVVLEALKERSSLAELSQKHDLHPQQITKWKRDFLAGASSVLSKPHLSVQDEAEAEKARLLQIIGEQKVELDFLKKKFRRFLLKFQRFF
ncbi:MAG: transposase [Bacteroidota bacterium]